MQHIDIIQESLDYIEDNLKAAFDAKELAERAGYSLFHYYRLFRKTVGMPVVQYITKRKLLHAVYDIAQGAKVTDVALVYGFDTKSGFHKAFVREFGCSSSEYIAAHAIRPPYRIKLIDKECIILTQKKIKEVLAQWNRQEEPITDFYYAGTDRRSQSEWNIGENAVLRASTNAARLEKHIKISKALVEYGFGASQPIPTVDGKDYYSYGELCFCLETKVIGTPVKSGLLYQGGGEITAAYVGELIGQLDLVLAKFNREFVGNAPNMLTQLKNYAIPKVKKVMPLPESFYNDYLLEFAELYSHLPVQLIHRNPCLGSFFLCGDMLSGVCDFELSEENLRIFDPCYAATSVLSENFTDESLDRMKWFDIYRDIIAGYDRVAKLSAPEKQAIPYVVFGIQMICIAYFSGSEKYKELADINIAMLEWLIKNKEQLAVM